VSTTYNITFSVVTTGLNGTAIPTQAGSGQFIVGTLPICTTANGGITKFQITLLTGASVTNPSPSVLFDALDLENVGNELQFNTATLELSGTPAGSQGSLTELIVSGTAPGVGYPFPAIMEFDPTTPGNAAGLSINPPEGVMASGTYQFAPAAAAVPINTPYPSGGGSPYRCPPQGCESLGPTKSRWGPLRISRDDTGLWAAYQNQAGNLYSIPLNPDHDLVAQLAHAVTMCERVPSHLNNPGAITYGLGRLYQFPSPAAGRAALARAIQASLQTRRVL